MVQRTTPSSAFSASASDNSCLCTRHTRLSLDQARRLKELEQENARLKRLVADQTLDNGILKEVLAGETFKPGKKA